MIKSLQNMFKLVVLLAVAFPIGEALAQDPHFTQFSATPLAVNPALTGVFDGTFRASNVDRTQWSGLGKGYTTLHLSGDLPIGKGEIGNNYFGIGFLLYRDKAGLSGLSSTIVEASLSYIASLDPAKNHFLSFGFQAGLNQQSIDLTKATWDSQWNGDGFDPSLLSHEVIQLQQFSYLDFNAGMMYYFVPDEYNSFSVGASMSHVGSPNVTFFKDAETPLRRKYTLHSSAEISLNKENVTWITPKLLYMQQGNQREIMFGGYVKNKVQFKSRYTNYQKESYFYVGGFYRWNDAAVIAAKFEYNTIGVGLSYDINTSYLSSLTSAHAFEVSISYVSYVKRGKKIKHYSKTPRFF